MNLDMVRVMPQLDRHWEHSVLSFPNTLFSAALTTDQHIHEGNACI